MGREVTRVEVAQRHAGLAFRRSELFILSRSGVRVLCEERRCSGPESQEWPEAYPEEELTIAKLNNLLK